MTPRELLVYYIGVAFGLAIGFFGKEALDGKHTNDQISKSD